MPRPLPPQRLGLWLASVDIFVMWGGVMDHPLLDGRAGRYVWTETLGDRVCFTEGMGSFFAWASRQGSCPVVVTRPNGRLSYPLAAQMRACGARWVCRTADGFQDMRSGVVYPSVEAVPDTPQDAGVLAARVDQSHVWWCFSASVDHPANESTVTGGVVEAVWRIMTGAAPAVWGLHEPCLSRWDKAAYTRTARGLMPQAPMVVSGGHRPAQAIATVGRTPTGVTETVTGVAVAGRTGAENTDGPGLGILAVETLRMVAQSVSMPSMAMVSVAHGGAGVWFETPWTDPVMPLAVLIGPRLLRDLGDQARTFIEQFGGVPEGRGKLTSMVVPLWGTGAGVWDRLQLLLAGISGDQTAGLSGLLTVSGEGV